MQKIGCKIMKKDLIEHPKTLEEAIEKLFVWVSKKDQKWLAKQTKDELYLLHHGFGTWIRNTFGLWGKNSKLIYDISKCNNGTKPIHPDDCSMVIIEEFQKAIRKKLKVKQEVERMKV